MTTLDPQQLVVAGTLCGVLASWLLGVALHVRFLRSAPSASRAFFRVLLPLHADHAMSHVMVGLNRSPHFIAILTGRLEGVLTASIRPTRNHTAPDAAQLACRVENFGAESQVRVRLDFTPSIERSRRRLHMLLLVIWPGWIALVVAVVLVSLSLTAEPGAWWALNLLHAVYPLALVVALHARFARTRSLLHESIGAVVENLRFLPT
ncbi:MAG: hypothetical protein JRF63_08280 [Deltaproteobacteria bacterium]|nr:hypothetical protein [Deltaproteobacteria bacterium]